MLTDVGLDPEDTHESEYDPIGIGNLCGRKINEFRDNDGQNSKGDIINGRKNTKYNHEPFSDYTGYQVTSSDSLRNIKRLNMIKWLKKLLDTHVTICLPFAIAC